ncbi:MAG: nitrile hydratase subunit alpha [Rhodospirillaceae bacterium]|nr:nitrile hydratase subunit alpha [Rhodospirillaceae bacterium]
MAHDHAHNAPPSETAMRVKALETLLTEKGLLDPAAIDALVETYETKIGPRNGAKVVARAWTDPDYKQRLLEDGTAAIAELGFSGVQGEDMVVVENTDDVHNLVTCTLCSCYPWPTLGLPPIWFKSAPYRARSVIDPRGVLEEFGVELSEEIEVRVWDSNAELRYLVLPQRPAGTDGMSEDELAALVTRDSMIGTALAEAPAG